MTHGLLWLPLLVFFFWLAWTGWREYQKVEAYQQWATAFDRAKYDIYSVLGQKGDELTWGIPTRQEPINLETIALQSIDSIQLRVNGQVTDFADPPAKGRAELELVRHDRPSSTLIPFTEPPLAAKWGQHLQRELQRVKELRDGG
ncbi:MAG: hypothetical protein NW224_30580 [Leptolyngbyaceae cyanobacterium bins.302]|nr:hypothetical protein [Leptolyngbyaceae cyanobacterium bins.302]